MARALEFSDTAAWDFRQTLFTHLSKPDWNPRQLVGAITAHVEEVGKDATARRERLINVVDQTAGYFRQAMREASGIENVPEGEWSTTATGWTGGPQRASECVQRCLEAQGHVRANANQATLIECWIDDLATLTRA